MIVLNFKSVAAEFYGIAVIIAKANKYLASVAIINNAAMGMNTPRPCWAAVKCQKPPTWLCSRGNPGGK